MNNVKAIIFDLDNTLIMWHTDFIKALKKVINDMNYEFDDDIISKIDNMIDNYEHYNNTLSKEELLNYINKNCNLNLNIDFIEKLIIEQGDLYYADKTLIKVIEYLSKKYDLYVVTNWFTITQKKRLENMGILKYFKNVIGADINYLKPDKRSFDCILKNYKSNECISIGDTLENDVLLPLSLGMHAIWLTKKKSNKYKTINNINELIDIL